MTYSGSQAQSGRGSTLAIGEALSITGNITLNSESVAAVSSTTGIVAGMPITGAGIPSGTTVTNGGTDTLTLSAEATATATAVALSVGPATIGEIKTSNHRQCAVGHGRRDEFRVGAGSGIHQHDPQQWRGFCRRQSRFVRSRADAGRVGLFLGRDSVFLAHAAENAVADDNWRHVCV